MIKNLNNVLLLLVLFLSITVLLSCSKDDDGGGREPEIGSAGMFVLNEGSYFYGVNGSLSYIDYGSNTLTDGLFALANNRTLGGTPNDMALSDGMLVICCTDENRVEVVNATTFRSLQSFEVKKPRCVCIVGQGFYVSSLEGIVTYFSFDGKQRVESSNLGGNLEGIAYFDGYIYVCNAYNSDYTYNTNVIKLSPYTLQKNGDIIVTCNPTELKVGDGKLFVKSTGNYVDVNSQIQTIDKAGKVAYVCDATLFDVVGNEIVAVELFSDWTTGVTQSEYFRITAAGDRKSLLDATAAEQIYSPCCIAADALTNMIFVSSYKKNSAGFADYAGKGEVFQFSVDGDFVRRYDAGVGPCTMVSNVKIY